MIIEKDGKIVNIDWEVRLRVSKYRLSIYPTSNLSKLHNQIKRLNYQLNYQKEKGKVSFILDTTTLILTITSQEKSWISKSHYCDFLKSQALISSYLEVSHTS